ncbi:MAG TPA: aryl-sulfate sulfotransferase [Candidatus Sulfotelmatobacter sp.]|nr:aryl-sulfate sulfotransferase [Candidatus Sulfotelmatobacter sp.]
MSLPLLLCACAFLAGCGSGGSNSATPLMHVAVSNTQNPMVAQVEIGSGCTGQAMVEFGPDTTYGRNTSWYPINAFQLLDIQVAGMRASTLYHLRVQRQCPGNDSTGNDTTFMTGAPPSTPFPAIQVSRPDPPVSGSENPGVELVDLLAPTSNQIQALVTDRDANPIWFYPVDATYYPYTFKLLQNGHFLFSLASNGGDSLIREVDLAGNTIRQLDITVLEQRMQSAGFDFSPTGYHHDFLPLDNGHLIVLTNVVKNFTDLAGYPGTIQVISDALIDLDQNWNPVWGWNSFDHLDVNRHLFGLPDWTHSNAVLYSPNDGNLLLSMRHQSWILKIDYNNGAGTGNILWKLGYQGDFALAQGDDPSLWFSFQHFPSLISQNGSLTTLAIWDNGDYRVLDTSGSTCLYPGPPDCYSRATIFQLDESAMVANLQWQYLPGLFSVWGGSINQLANGNVEFDLNAPEPPPAPSPDLASEVQEVTQTSSPEVIWKMDMSLPMNAYRAYRVPSLYPGVSWQY